MITPFGLQLRTQAPWYGHEHFGDWPHKGSALSSGESSVLKYGVTYPLRTGLENPDGQPFPETVDFGPATGSGTDTIFEEIAAKGDGNLFEEVFLSHGVCTVSVGPLGGPSDVKALYRPSDSYGTGAKVKSVVKTEFPQDIKTDNSDLKGLYKIFQCGDGKKE